MIINIKIKQYMLKLHSLKYKINNLFLITNLSISIETFNTNLKKKIITSFS